MIAMALCAFRIQPLITCLQVTSTAKQCSFADDARKTGSTTEMKRQWDILSILGPDFGYLLNNKERLIITKPDKKESVNKYLRTLRHAAEACYATSPSAKNMGRLNFVKNAVVIHRGE